MAALLDGEASGYELTKRFDVSVANFWRTTSQQIYTELPKLEAAGLIQGRAVRQQGKPDKRLYHLTAAGAQELARFVAAPAKPTAIKDELLVKVQAADAGDNAKLIETLNERAATAAARAQFYQELLTALLEGRDEDTFIRTSARVGPYLTCKRGQLFEQENHHWCTWAAGVLRSRTSPDNPATEASRGRASHGTRGGEMV